uniref:Putative secreted protein n=1 Tax=Ixodes ricinus TaxID=34613 RepID=A0A6B0UAV2_IXORI
MHKLLAPIAGAPGSVSRQSLALFFLISSSQSMSPQKGAIMRHLPSNFSRNWPQLFVTAWYLSWSAFARSNMDFWMFSSRSFISLTAVEVL